jgi:ribonuclease BN (tRNA processing enzyme)
MAPLTLITLGVGDAFSALRYSSCVAVGAAGAWLLVDCPHPIRKILRESGTAAGVDLDVESFEAVVVTHLHADHSSGVEGLGYYSHFGLGRRARLVVHPDVARNLWDGHLAAGMAQLLAPDGASPVAKRLEDYFELAYLSERQPLSVGPFSIECRLTHHHIPTTALRISAGGRSLGYSADTSFDPDLIEWLAQADLVVHETNYGIHTPYAKLAALPAAVRAKMRLIHYPDDFDLAGTIIEPLRQGARYEV